MTNMQCPSCGAKILVGDRFCEECGASVLAKNTITKPTDGCQKCGASAEQIDDEGYCLNCGFRREALRDRTEIVVEYNLAGVTDLGLKHLHNEDFLACAKVNAKNAYIIVVCDGVSSSQSPELAAKAAATIACQTLYDTIEKSDISAETAIKLAIKEALASVCAIPYTQTPDLDPPSTTIIAAVAIDRTATIGWLGDSRAYWISAQNSHQLTQDHSWLNEVVSSGQINELEARKSPQAHAITRWLGLDAAENWESTIAKFDISVSGHLLLCSDGFWNYAPAPTQIAEIINNISSGDAITISRTLVEFALNKGGHDNITVALVSI